MSGWLSSVNNLLENLDGQAETVAETVAEQANTIINTYNDGDDSTYDDEDFCDDEEFTTDDEGENEDYGDDVVRDDNDIVDDTDTTGSNRSNKNDKLEASKNPSVNDGTGRHRESVSAKGSGRGGVPVIDDKVIATADDGEEVEQEEGMKRNKTDESNTRPAADDGEEEQEEGRNKNKTDESNTRPITPVLDNHPSISDLTPRSEYSADTSPLTDLSKKEFHNNNKVTIGNRAAGRSDIRNEAIQSLDTTPNRPKPQSPSRLTQKNVNSDDSPGQEVTTAVGEAKNTVDKDQYSVPELGTAAVNKVCATAKQHENIPAPPRPPTKQLRPKPNREKNRQIISPVVGTRTARTSPSKTPTTTSDHYENFVNTRTAPSLPIRLEY